MSSIRWALLASAIMLLVLMLAGGPGYHSPRSVLAAWEFGHVVAFALWSYLLVVWSPLEKAVPARQWGAVLGFCLVAGAATEGVQRLIGGDASTGDLLRDLVGGLFALAWLVPSTRSAPPAVRRAARAASAVLLMIACLPLARAVADEG